MTINPMITYKDKLYLLQEGRCFYCLGRMARASYRQLVRPNGFTEDHVIPRHTGVTGCGNKVLACRKCNERKGGKLPSNKALRKYALLYGEILAWPNNSSKALKKLADWRLPYY